MQHNYAKVLSILVFTLLCSVGFAPLQAQQNGPTPYKFKYRVTAIKSGSNSVSSLSNIADVVPKPLIYIPNAFTPNGDGLNDGFGVKAEGIHDFRMEIFNRWGELIFSTTDINELWDGTYKGRKLENTEVFVYKVSAAGYESPPQKFNGTVTLVYE